MGYSKEKSSILILKNQCWWLSAVGLDFLLWWWWFCCRWWLPPVGLDFCCCSGGTWWWFYCLWWLPPVGLDFCCCSGGGGFVVVDDFHPLDWTFCCGGGGFVVVNDLHPLDWMLLLLWRWFCCRREGQFWYWCMQRLAKGARSSRCSSSVTSTLSDKGASSSRCSSSVTSTLSAKGVSLITLGT